MTLTTAALIALTLGAGNSTAGAVAQLPPGKDQAAAVAITSAFRPVELVADLKPLSANEQKALAYQLRAARVMNGIFLRQAWAGNLETFARLSADDSKLARLQTHALLINQGPWDRLNDGRSFLAGAPDLPVPANFYPPGATRAQVESWEKSLAPDARAKAQGFYSVIRWAAGGGGMVSVPYSLEYQPELFEAARLLRSAAELTESPTLKTFLLKRADAFVSNDYYPSELAWMKVDGAVDTTIGPYEVYDDRWFNAKSSYEAFISIRDDAETQRLATLASHLQEIESHLPIDAELRNPKVATSVPIRVVNPIYLAGDARKGVITAAYNLPNDERVLREAGTKRVMLKNIQRAKFDASLMPLSRMVLSAADQKKVKFDAFFTHILMHELMHGLGPHEVRTDKKTTVRQALAENSSALEEAKADISGLFALQFLVDQGVLDKSLAETMYVTNLASMFRTLRFGTTDDHARGVALQLNTLMDAGAVRVVQGRFEVVPAKMKQAVADLTRQIMTLQASGSRDDAGALLTKMGVLRPEAKKVLDAAKSLPVDIEPRYSQAEQLMSSLAP